MAKRTRVVRPRYLGEVYEMAFNTLAQEAYSYRMAEDGMVQATNNIHNWEHWASLNDDDLGEHLLDLMAYIRARRLGAIKDVLDTVNKWNHPDGYCVAAGS